MTAITSTEVGGHETSGEGRLPHLPALDGLRALALLAVLLDHGGVGWVVGGHLGVTAFFVLSGFLVTSLLVLERRRTGAIDVRAFWVRRARRLVPASLLLVGLVLAYLAYGGDDPPSTVLGDGLASMAWLANWRFVLDARSYGDLFADPTPFAHLWSLAVEEQLYLVLPVAAVALLGRRGAARTGRLALGLAIAVAASSAWMWVLHEPGADPFRVYYGTDTRLAELAVGALLGVALVGRGELLRLGRAAGRAAQVVGGVALAGLALLVHRSSVTDDATFGGGLLLAAALSAAVVLACTQGGWLARALSAGPLPAVGRRTYGAYLFHWPLFLWIDEASTGLEGPALLAVRLAATAGLAAASYALVEQPVRTGALGRPLGGLVWADVAVGLAAALALLTALPTSPSSSVLAAAGADEPPPLAPPPTLAPPVTATAPTTPAPTLGPAPAPGAAPAVDGTVAPAPAATAAPRPGRPAPGPATTAPPPRPGGPPGGPDDTSEPPSPPPPPPPPPLPSGPTPGEPAPGPTGAPLRVAVVGDSLATDLADGLEVYATGRSDILVYDLAILACPISRGGTRRFPDGSDFPVKAHCDWWDDPTSERSVALRDFDPDVVLVEDALNEVVDRRLPEWDDYRRVGDPRFDAWLLEEYRQAAEVFSAGGASVVYADAPCADWARVARWGSLEDADRRVAALNRIYDGVVAATTQVADLHERLCPGGRYRDEVEGVADGRPDGFHLADEAARRLAERWLAPFLRQVGPRAPDADPAGATG